MNYLLQVRRAIEFIEAHLDQDVDLREVSTAAGVSHWHFLRMFKALTHETLKSYIRSRRLSEARVQLITTDDSILSIAVRAGFESQASFTRAFQTAFGMPPAQYRSLGGDKIHLEKLKIDESYLRHLESGLNRQPTIKDRPQMIMVGLVTQFYGVESERNNLAERIPALWMALLPRLEEIPGSIPGVCYALIQQAGTDDERLEYTAAMQVERAPSDQELPEGMNVRTVPASRYASFEHRGRVDLLNETVNYIYGNYLLRSSSRHNYGPDLEVYDKRFIHDSDKSVIDYEIPIGT